MTRSGGRPRHNLSSFITILKKNRPEDKNRQCLCKCCVEILKEEAKRMTNRKERIKKHLAEYEHFLNKYDEEAGEILTNCNSEDEETPPAKNMRLDG